MKQEPNIEFEELALKVATRRNTHIEFEALTRLLSAHPELKSDYQNLCKNVEKVWMLKAIDAPYSPIPEHAIASLRAEVARTFPSQQNQVFLYTYRSLLAVGVVLLMISFIGANWHRDGFEKKITFQSTQEIPLPRGRIYLKKNTKQENAYTPWYYFGWAGVSTLGAGGVMMAGSLLLKKRG